jgi:predicted permease
MIHPLWLDDVGRDVRYAARTLRRHPGFAVAAMLSLALGIGANTAIFSLIDQVLLRRLPVREPDRLVLLNWNVTALRNQFGAGNTMPYPWCRDLHEQDFSDGVFCRAPTNVFLSTGGQHELEAAEIVTGSYFDVLGVRAAQGRLIGESDDAQPGNHPVVVLSYDYWRTRLGGAADAVGRRVLVNNHPMTVIGVAAEGFRGVDVGSSSALWIPATMTSQAIPEIDSVTSRRLFFMHAFARLKPGRTLAQTTASLRPWFASALESETRREDFPTGVSDDDRRQFLASTIDMAPGDQGWSTVRGTVRRPLLLLMAGTTVLLLLACLNVASLMLARGAERTREMSTRLAMGATRARVTAQVLVEGLLIAAAGGLLGLIAVPIISRVILTFLPGADVPPPMDARIFLFALAVTAATGSVCAMAPALQATRRSLMASMNRRDDAPSAGAVRIRKAIVIAQLAFTLLLLVGAGLFVQTLMGLYSRDRGFDGSRLVLFRADAASMGHAEADAARVMRELIRVLQQQPAVERAALANTSVLTGGGASRVITVQSDRRVVAEGFVPILRVTPGFFSTLGTRLTEGRDFADADTRELEKTGFRSVIVNESFARRYFGNGSPIGHRLGIGNRPDTPTNIEIIGVVNDFRLRSLRDEEDPEHVFFPFADSGELAGDGVVYVRVRGEPEAALTSIRRAVAAVDPSLPLIDLRTVEDQVDRALRPERMLATLSSGFGAIALLLSVVGLYGVMSFVVTQRTREIGLRLALGATRSAAVWLVLREALVMVAGGIAIALPTIWAVSRLIEAQLFDVRAFDGATLATASSGLAFVALGAASLPAWRAAVLPPMVAMRDQPESMWQTARQTLRRAVHGLTAEADRPVPPVTLIHEFTGLVQNAASFSEALRVALPSLRERVGARSLVLLEKVSSDEYRSGDLSLSVRGVLLNRLTHYRHPLPLGPGELQAWSTWASEFRPEQVLEVERLRAAGVRMAVALRTKLGIVGVLLLGPPEGREEYAAADRQVLSSAAEIFALMIENARLNDRALEQEKVRRDLALAAEVQRRLLPALPPVVPAAGLAAFTLPARSIGGDFYDFVELPGGRIGIAVADIAGKGIAAALLTSVVQASLRMIASEPDITPSQLAGKMNRFLQRSTASNGYATFFYAVLDPNGRRLRYVNAGHNPPYLVRGTGVGVHVGELSAGGTVLGLFPEVAYEDAEVDLCPGDLLVAFTDGVTEARNMAGEEFGEERLKDLLQRAVGMPAAQVSSTLAEQLQHWITGAEQHDDVTFVVARVN